MHNLITRSLRRWQKIERRIKNYYYVQVISENKIKFVTSVDNEKQVTYWEDDKDFKIFENKRCNIKHLEPVDETVEVSDDIEAVKEALANL